MNKGSKIYVAGHVNIGTGEDITIKELAETIAAVVGYRGTMLYDTLKPDGMKRKVLDVSKMTGLGWKSKTDLLTGLKMTYNDYSKKR